MCLYYIYYTNIYIYIMYFNILRFTNFDIKYTKKTNKIEKNNRT